MSARGIIYVHLFFLYITNFYCLLIEINCADEDSSISFLASANTSSDSSLKNGKWTWRCYEYGKVCFSHTFYFIFLGSGDEKTSDLSDSNVKNKGKSL